MKCIFSYLARIGLAAGILLSIPPAAQSQSLSPEAGFIRTMGDRAIALLSSQSISPEQRSAGFGDLLTSGFELNYIGRFVLGRHWKAATATQRTEYLELFRRYVVATYASRLQGYSGETFEIVSQRPAGPKDVIVRTRIAKPGAGASIHADWRVRNFGGTRRVIDVMVEGISMAITQRQEFSAVVRRKGISGLIADLRIRTTGFTSAQRAD